MTIGFADEYPISDSNTVYLVIYRSADSVLVLNSDWPCKHGLRVFQEFRKGSFIRQIILSPYRIPTGSVVGSEVNTSGSYVRPIETPNDYSALCL